MTGSSAREMEAARAMLEVSVTRLWVDYFALGGSLGPGRIADFLAGGPPLGDYDHDLLTHALNERFLEEGDDHPLGYTGDPGVDRP